MHNIKEIRVDTENFTKSLKKSYIDIDIKKIILLDENNRNLFKKKKL